MENKLLYQYQNGNVLTTIYEDGTKINEWEGDAEFEFLSSADIKLTNSCSLGDKFDKDGNLLQRSKTCEFCHEMSNNIGKHGNLELIKKIWDTHQPGTEMALGGGNVFEHPDIEPFLYHMAGKGFLPNITMNTLHMKPYADRIRALQEDKAIRGIGISYRGPEYMDKLPDNVLYNNAVFHMILGVNDLKDVKAVINWCKVKQVKPKILLLGYKQFGNGIKVYSPELQTKINKWKLYLPILLGMEGLTLSFDNLAITQIGVEKYMSKEDWNMFYGGTDGLSTGYLSAVDEEFARTSTSNTRYPLSMIKNVRDITKIIHLELKLETVKL